VAASILTIWPVPLKTLKLYESGFHDLLNDIDKNVVMQDIKGWISARLPAEQVTPALVQAATL
jgi:alpha-beta hydrolase superfamily lysophospholipase